MSNGISCVPQSPSAQSVPRLCLSALSGGGGKTLLCLGLVRAFAARGWMVQPFKKGPDYIDAAWLSLAAGRPACNLDPYMLSSDRLKALFWHVMARLDSRSARVALLEGNRGLFDGMDSKGSCSTVTLARILQCPVVLCVDCTKMTRTVAALVMGVLAFEEHVPLVGVILNQLASARHEEAVRRALEDTTDIPVLGALPRLPKNPLPERHMGLASAGRELAPDAVARLDQLGALVADHVDVDGVLRRALAAPALAPAPPFWPALDAVTINAGQTVVRPRIGYVRDAALWFYYEENLEALRRAGAELVCLSLVDGAGAHAASQKPLPSALPALHGLYLGGGFPEDYAAALSASSYLRILGQWAEAGMPIYAECGGFILLAQGLALENRFWPMAGIFPFTVRWTSTPQGLGYVLGTVVRENPYFPVGMEIRGHEFHYSQCVWEETRPTCALHLSKGHGMGGCASGTGGDGLIYRQVWASYTHIFAPTVPCWAERFTAAARRFATDRASSVDAFCTNTTSSSPYSWPG